MLWSALHSAPFCTAEVISYQMSSNGIQCSTYVQHFGETFNVKRFALDDTVDDIPIRTVLLRVQLLQMEIHSNYSFKSRHF